MAGIHNMLIGENLNGFTPVTRTFSSGSSAVETAPAGATNVVIELWGGGGGGGKGTGIGCGADYGPQGSTGGYVRSSYSTSGGSTVTYTIGSGGKGRDTTASTPGGASSVVSGSLSITTMSAGGGAQEAGAGGTATGGNVVNSSGFQGSFSSVSGPNPAQAGVNGNTTGTLGRGGAAGFGASGNGATGSNGAVVFYYT